MLAARLSFELRRLGWHLPTEALLRPGATLASAALGMSRRPTAACAPARCAVATGGRDGTASRSGPGLMLGLGLGLGLGLAHPSPSPSPTPNPTPNPNVQLRRRGRGGDDRPERRASTGGAIALPGANPN